MHVGGGKKPTKTRLRLRINGALMTCCIAAACDRNQTIVTVSDTKVSWGHTSSEEIFKLVRIQHPYWLGMLAGEDMVLGAESVTRRLSDVLSKYKNAPPTAVQVRDAIINAWRDTQNEVAGAAVLNPYGITVKEFLSKRLELGSRRFDQLFNEVLAASELKCELMAIGFDDQKIPTILICSDDYPACADASRVGYYALGSGQTSAMNMLLLQNYSVQTEIRTAIYQLCAAKFAAEKAEGVSDTTVVMCLNQKGETAFIEGQPIDALRAFWESDGRPRSPDAAALVTHLKPLRWLITY